MIRRLILLPALAVTLSFSNLGHAHMGQYHQCMHSVFKKLNLSAEQKSKVKELKEQMKQACADKRAQMKMLHDQMKEMVKADTIDESKLNDLINQKKDLMGAKMKDKIMMRHAIYHLFTPKQKEMYSTLADKCEQKMMDEMKSTEQAN